MSAHQNTKCLWIRRDSSVRELPFPGCLLILSSESKSALVQLRKKTFLMNYRKADKTPLGNWHPATRHVFLAHSKRNLTCQMVCLTETPGTELIESVCKRIGTPQTNLEGNWTNPSPVKRVDQINIEKNRLVCVS